MFFKQKYRVKLLFYIER